MKLIIEKSETTPIVWSKYLKQLGLKDDSKMTTITVSDNKIEVSCLVSEYFMKEGK